MIPHIPKSSAEILAAAYQGMVPQDRQKQISVFPLRLATTQVSTATTPGSIFTAHPDDDFRNSTSFNFKEAFTPVTYSSGPAPEMQESILEGINSMDEENMFGFFFLLVLLYLIHWVCKVICTLRFR